WITNAEALQRFRRQLTEVRDLERTIGRLSVGTGNARDLPALRMALEQLPGLKKTLSGMGREAPPEPNDTLSEEVFQKPPPAGRNRADEAPALLAELESQLAELPALIELMARAIVDEPPLTVK